MKSVTCTAPVNIAIVKYWGKRDEKLVLPINSSLSLTLDQNQLRAKTTVAASPNFTEDRMWLNGEEQSIKGDRLKNVLQEIRRQFRKRKSDTDDMTSWHIHICSENNFPTAAGLASSAAGFACLVFSLSKLFGIGGDISRIARQGSGSACRSVYGGFVAWDMGAATDGSDSIARQIAPHTHWSDISTLLLVVCGGKKSVGSSVGMQLSVATSPLLDHRATNIVPHRMNKLTEAILDKDFHKFAEETMKDSNQLHAICLDTYPPISYITDTSRDIIRLIHAINLYYQQTKVCYTFDAGPNACLYLPSSSAALVMAAVQHFFPPTGNGDPFIRGIKLDKCDLEKEFLNSVTIPVSPGAIQYVISTKVGPGPQVLEQSESLLNDKGLPISLHTS